MEKEEKEEKGRNDQKKGKIKISTTGKVKERRKRRKEGKKGKEEEAVVVIVVVLLMTDYYTAAKCKIFIIRLFIKKGLPNPA